MKVTELIEEIPKTQPKVLDGIDEKTAADLVRHVFKHINDTLAGMGEGVVKYAGLGRFRVRRMKKEVEGKKIDRTQIVFRALPGGGKGDDGAED